MSEIHFRFIVREEDIPDNSVYTDIRSDPHVLGFNVAQIICILANRHKDTNEIIHTINHETLHVSMHFEANEQEQHEAIWKILGELEGEREYQEHQHAGILQVKLQEGEQ